MHNQIPKRYAEEFYSKIQAELIVIEHNIAQTISSICQDFTLKYVGGSDGNVSYLGEWRQI